MIRLKATAALLVCLAVVAVGASPAGAQFFDAPGSPYGSSPFANEPGAGRLTVDVKLGAATGTDSISVVGEDTDEALAEDLARSVSDAFGLKRSEASISTPNYDPFDGESSIYDSVIDSRKRLSEHQGDDSVLRVNTAELERIARNWGHDELRLMICTAGLPHEDRSTPKAEDVDGDCLNWTFNAVELASPQAPQIEVVTKPAPDRFFLMAGLSVGIMLALGIALAMAALLLRRKFSARLTPGTLVVAGIGLLLSVGSAGIGMIVFALTKRPITDFAAAYDLGEGAYVMTVLGLGLTAALPFFLPTLVLCRAAPRDYTPKPATFNPYAQPGAFVPPAQPALSLIHI